MRVPLLIAALAIATSAHALPPPPPPGGCSTNLDCASGLPCGDGVCVNGFCRLDPSPQGKVCRPKNGICDVQEVCDGKGTDCPADALAPTTTVCRPANGACDVAEHCTGRSAACPADGFVDSSVICRPAAGACDVDERCTGTGPACPVDQFIAGGTVCRAAANDCDLPEACTGTSKDCPGDSSAASGTACESASACISGGACAGPVCIGGQPELIFTPDPAQLSDSQHDVDIAIKHTGSGAPITLTGAAVDPAGTFSIVTAPQFPIAVLSGAEVHLTVRLSANAPAGDHSATLNVQATACADQPLQLRATVASPAPDGGTSPDGGGSQDGGDSPDGGTKTPGGPSSGGGCSSGSAPTGLLALIALAGFGFRRRRA